MCSTVVAAKLKIKFNSQWKLLTMKISKRLVITLVYCLQIVCCAPICWYLTTVEQESLPRDALQDAQNLTNLATKLVRDVYLIDNRRVTELCSSETERWGSWNVHFRKGTTDITWDLTKGITESVETYSDIFLNNEVVPNDSLVLIVTESDRVLFPDGFEESADYHLHLGPKRLGILSLQSPMSICESTNEMQELLRKVSLRGIEEDLAIDSHIGQVYQLTFNLLVSNQYSSVAKWDIEQSIRSYVQPFLDRLAHMAQFHVTSQILYHSKISDTFNGTVRDSEFEEFLTVNDWKIHSKAEEFDKDLHFMLYMDFENSTSLDNDVTYSTSVLVPRWGGVVVASLPSTRVALKLSQSDLHPAMARFVGQLRHLIGLSDCSKWNHVSCETNSGSGISDWEYDGLLKSRFELYLQEATDHLGAISTLLDEIPHMPVASRILEEILEILDIMDSIRQKREIDPEAVALAREAAKGARLVYFDPSLIPQIYFPPEFLYAVYLPLLAPMFLPLLSSFSKEFKRWKLKLRQEKS